MNCALCGNEDNLLIQVQSGSGLSLHLCPEHENTPPFEVAAMLAAENEKLIRRIHRVIAEIARLRKDLEYIKQYVGTECKCYSELNVNYIEPCVYCVAKDSLEEK